MSTRFNNGSHYENHAEAQELREGAAHAHEVAEEHGQGEHITGHERSRLDSEHVAATHSHAGTPTVGHGIVAFGHAEIAALAHQLWLARGCPEGTAEEDWFNAARELRSRAHSS